MQTQTLSADVTTIHHHHDTTVHRGQSPYLSILKLFLIHSEILDLNTINVIFTNEANIECWKNKRQVAVNSKIRRLNSFIKFVSVSFQSKSSNS
ncbi:hypothetical protein L2E82_01005 [Cichorium intybus]|uniref:Uncharacterized protein n=1 Tax=Cichorium intybus TaxID=13427 RepID=A0ACB9GYS5_CICIN|nr:hypothetical protein L2E82_01005 [Cichorium intybus]